ncbi:uncharacterized protein LOC126315323 isoform X2 [Schistocerca gregaria]|uniref:uncharacterized protein LOC126315323 isoform X2 n=1 Tax=Schistocerca gregaria TaxID=7010 RepID=UPI00211EA1D5|nr:uncharacterized protein LOC126315323 isoform X2 [Schistocerca gregaria]
MAGIAKIRLTEERKAWRKDHPHGFYAKPISNENGTLDIMKWTCGIPGKKGTIWEGGSYPLTIEFSDDYPTQGPICRFPPGFFHPNVYPSGKVCLSILTDDWKPSITVKQILTGIQELLDTPNENSPAQVPAFQVFVQDKKRYMDIVVDQRRKYLM